MRQAPSKHLTYSLTTSPTREVEGDIKQFRQMNLPGHESVVELSAHVVVLLEVNRFNFRNTIALPCKGNNQPAIASGQSPAA